MTLILSIWMVALILVVLLYIAAVSENMKDFTYRVAGIIDCLKDFGVQVWLGVSRLWKFNSRLRGLNKGTDEFDMYD